MMGSVAAGPQGAVSSRPGVLSEDRAGSPTIHDSFLLTNVDERGCVSKAGPVGANTHFSREFRRICARAAGRRRLIWQLPPKPRAARQATAEILQRIQAARARAEQICEWWLAARSDADRLRYPAYARLESMPVIERAKGIIMAQ